MTLRQPHVERTWIALLLFPPLMLIVVGFYSASSGENPAPSYQPEATSRLGPHSVTWSTGTGRWVGYWGRRESVACPAGGRLEAAWGTDIYTDDSSICSAAVHAGLISTNTGGVVMIEMRPDAGYYRGTTRNGVTTGDWGEPWTGGFVFVWDSQAPSPAIAASEHMRADSWPNQAGRRLSFCCAPLFQLHSVYGTDLYTDDSYVCSAAVHAGLITQKSGGMVTITLQNGQSSFEATVRNGVSSLSTDQWRGQSYRFVATPENTPLPPTMETPVTRPPGREPGPLVPTMKLPL